MSESKKSLSQKINELDAQVEWFHSEEFKLENAVEKYKVAVKLAKEIEQDLDSLKNEIEVLSEDFSK
ncbi:exodeoxyribonuclease VII small subunit [Candidatus Saccharibacteria bacterium]|nr:exodeoxyribonuclease VII small subunit [Candidatus Saccharibacteria bacterium]